jgi:TolB-like protein
MRTVAPKNFFAELKRRNVIRAAILYVGAVWALAQGISQLGPSVGAPEWATRWFLVAAAIAFPFWIAFAWFYEFTPEGLKRESEIDRAESITHRTGRKLDFAIICVLAVAVVLLLTDRFVLHHGANQTTAAPIPEKSIAVLPFENLSEEKQNEYFTDGVQDEILSDLAKIADLKVISRTSVMQYKSGLARNLRKIGEELGVAHVVEGSVQRSANKIRVIAQLIDVRNDAHLWAQTYDRELADVFAIQSEIAEAVADQLQARLSPSESHALSAVKTHDTEAYDLFLRGEYEFDHGNDPNYLDRADAFYRQALARDPNFVEAAAGLARSRLWRHWNDSHLAPAELEEVKSLIDRALALAPNSPEAHLALGLFFYWGHRQYEMALAEFNRALELQPSNALARYYCALVYRRRGEWERSLTDSERAEKLDPRDADIPAEIGNTYLALRLWKDAERAESGRAMSAPHGELSMIFQRTSRVVSLAWAAVFSVILRRRFIST